MGYRQKCCSKRIARSSRWISTANGGERFIQFMPEFSDCAALLIRFSSSSNTGRGHTSHHAGLLVCSGRRRRAGKASSLMVSFIPFASVSLLCALDRVGKGNSEPKSAARVSV